MSNLDVTICRSLKKSLNFDRTDTLIVRTKKAEKIRFREIHFL